MADMAISVEEQTDSIQQQSSRQTLVVFLPCVVLLLSLLAHLLLPDRQLVFSVSKYTRLLQGLLVVYIGLGVVSYLSPRWHHRISHHAPLAAAFFFLLALYEACTLKSNWLPLPYFPSPEKIFEAYFVDGKLLASSVFYSLRLLVAGYVIGVIVGIPTGVFLGWSRRFRYWVNPIIRLLGPVPATAWIPIVLTIFPTSFSASTFLIALSTWFPVAVMTWSGVANINKGYFEIAETLGATPKYMIWHISLPGALPQIFVGLFMGMGGSFVTLIAAEMLGVRAGLGWYMTWAQGWGEYYKVYAALLISAVLFSSVVSLLFIVRDRLLIWQEGTLKW